MAPEGGAGGVLALPAKEGMERKDLRIVFMGTPEFAVETLRALVEGGCNVVAVVTQPDKPVGRRQELRAPEVKRYALSAGLPVLQPVRMKDPEFIGRLRSYGADLQVVVAFRMLPEAVWAMPRYGTFNVHAALLPQYRGAAPINWAVINGETVTGVTTFFIDKEIDTGRVILKKSLGIGPDDDAGKVHDGLMHLGARAAIETVDMIVAGDGRVESMAQDDMAVGAGGLRTAPKIFNETCRIDWDAGSKRVHDFIRGLSPCPGAWTIVRSPSGRETVLKVFRSERTSLDSSGHAPGDLVAGGGALCVATRDTFLRLLDLQLGGKRRMDAGTFLNGFREIESHALV